MTETLRITVGDGIGEVSALLRMPLVADSLFVFAHGAGAGMRHTFMEAIADRLFISPKTADHHIQHIYDKIGVSTRAAAALWAMQHAVVG